MTFLRLFKVLPLVLLFLVYSPYPARAGEEPAKKSTDQVINDAFKPVSKFVNDVMFQPVPLGKDSNDNKIEVPWVILWLGFAAFFLTIFFKFVNLRLVGLAVKTVRGKYSKASDPGQITHFQALSSALSGTVGLGNIGGVAVAVSAGGPGAAFWMIVIGFLGMTTKFAECTLGVKYRQIDPDGTVRGGPMYYLKEGLKERKLAKLGWVLAGISAITFICGAFGAGNMYQVNQSCDLVYNLMFPEAEGKKWIFGLLMAVAVGAVIIGGIKSIAKVTSKLVPSMCILYLLGGSVVLVANFSEIPGAIGLIIGEAFNPKSAIVGGVIGVFIQGMRRATFSNEAGLGSAPVAHSAVKTSQPASEGVVALLEPLIDTLIVCTMTALVLVTTGVHEGADVGSTGLGIVKTSEAFGTVMAWFPYVLMIAVVLFAFSTMITWSYYGEQAVGYLFGKSKAVSITYKVVFCLCAIVGASANLGNILDFSDATLFMMCVPNLIGVYILLPVIRDELKKFQAHAEKIDQGS